MEPVPRSIAENFENLYEWVRRLDRRIPRASGATALLAGGRLGSRIGLITNLNNARATGWYQASNDTANTPLPTGSFLVEVVQLGSETVTQRAHRYASFPDDFDQEWTRRFTVSGGWGPWHLRSMTATDFTPEWIGAGELAGTAVYASYAVTDGLAVVELFQRFGSGTYGDLQLRNPLAAYSRPPGATKVIQCAGRFTSSGTTQVATPMGLLASNADRLYARVHTVSGSQLTAGAFSSANPGGITATGGLSAMWTYLL